MRPDRSAHSSGKIASITDADGSGMKYKLVIFDFDGTLADSYPWFLSIFADLAKRYRLPAVDPSDLEKLRSLEVHQILKEYRIPFWKMLLIGNHLKKLMNAQIEQINLVNGMQAVIDTLSQQDIQLAIVTSNAEKNVRQVLGPQNMARFHYMESGVSMFGKKKVFEKILKKSKIVSQEALSIGDEVRDLKSARDARIPFGAVTWGYTARGALQKHAPEALFDHPREIIEMMQGG